MQHVYSTKLSRIFSQSLTTWLYTLVLIVADFIFVINRQFGALVFVTLLLSFLVIPSLYIFAIYYKYSAGKRLIVNDTYIGLSDKTTHLLVKIGFDEIKDVVVAEPGIYQKTPWNTHGYASVNGNNGSKIIVTSYMISLDDFTSECIQGRVRNDQIVTKKENYPIF